ncbi:hypothetical protein KI387_010101, partial [Taxus chinensis]
MTEIAADWRAVITAEYAKNQLASKILEGEIEDEKYKVVDGLILYKNKVFLVPESKVKSKILEAMHDSPLAGHPECPGAKDLVQQSQDILKALKDNLSHAQNQQKLYANQRRVERSFEVGDMVFLEATTIQAIFPQRERIGKAEAKKALGQHISPSMELPPLDDEGKLVLELEVIIEERERKLHNRTIKEYLENRFVLGDYSSLHIFYLVHESLELAAENSGFWENENSSKYPGFARENSGIIFRKLGNKIQVFGKEQNITFTIRFVRSISRIKETRCNNRGCDTGLATVTNGPRTLYRKRVLMIGSASKPPESNSCMGNQRRMSLHFQTKQTPLGSCSSIVTCLHNGEFGSNSLTKDSLEEAELVAIVKVPTRFKTNKISKENNDISTRKHTRHAIESTRHNWARTKGSFDTTDRHMVSPKCQEVKKVLSYRGAISSLREQASYEPSIPSIQVDFKLCQLKENLRVFPSLPIKVRYHSPEEEIALGPACWLWDYLRRSGASGYLLPLSGGADSSSVAAIVGCMCQLVTKAITDGNQQVKSDAIRIGQYKKGDLPLDTKEFAKRIFYTVYMGSENSSDSTRELAKRLSNEIGSWHLDVKIDNIVSSLISLFQSLTGKTPRYKVDGGTNAENLALQNIQARVRMIIAFLFASLMPWVQSKSGFFLVLGSSNVDEGLRGYLTKYDCSSADINPIGSVSKQDLRMFLRWATVNLGYMSLAEIEAAPPTAELEPIRSNYSQLDEADMGMTYEELSMYGRLRKIFRCGPVSMFQHLCHRWCGRLTPAEVAVKVKDFFRYYSANRHKMTTLTPSYHAE